MRIYLVDKPVCKFKVDNCLIIYIRREVIAVTCKSHSQSMIEVEHTGYSVETETVEFIFLKPKTDVRKEKVQYFILVIVEAVGIPGRMFASCSFMEKLVTGSIVAS